MTKFIMIFFIFCVVLFIYLHIHFQLKTSNDLEMYEIDHTSKDKLEEICDLRQPVLFETDTTKINETTNKSYLLNNYGAFEIKIRNVKSNESDAERYMPLPIKSAFTLFDEDKSSSYLSENNIDFLKETGVIKNLQYNDEFFRPYMVSNCDYDIITGSDKVTTPFKYGIDYRNYLILTEGTAQIKLSPPHSIRYLFPKYDYDNFEFSSSINPWNVEPKYKADFDKIKCLEIILTPGKMLYIPAYWWYTFKFDDNTSVSCFKYRTYMNNIAISPNICMYALQNQNVERKIAKPIDIIKDKIESKNDTTLIEDLNKSNSNNNDNNNNNGDEIPSILIPKEEADPLPQMDLLGEPVMEENNVISSSL